MDAFKTIASLRKRSHWDIASTCSQSLHIIEYAGSAMKIAGDLRFAGSNYKTHITQTLDGINSFITFNTLSQHVCSFTR